MLQYTIIIIAAKTLGSSKITIWWSANNNSMFGLCWTLLRSLSTEKWWEMKVFGYSGVWSRLTRNSWVGRSCSRSFVLYTIFINFPSRLAGELQVMVWFIELALPETRGAPNQTVCEWKQCAVFCTRHLLYVILYPLIESTLVLKSWYVFVTCWSALPKFGPSISLRPFCTPVAGCGAHCARAFVHCAKDTFGLLANLLDA